MKRLFGLGFILCACFTATTALAHFGMVIPSQSSVSEAKKSTLQLALKFWHPFENVGMNLEKPASFSVYHDGKSTDLSGYLTEKKEQGHSVWGCDFPVQKPGLFAFVMEPKPYFEEAEDCFIVHLTKVYVNAFGDDDGWDKPLGLKTEIVPMLSPMNLYAGNIFQGQVLRDGYPVPNAEVEVEWYPGPGLKGQAPHEGMVAQTVRTDHFGVFMYAAPASGWWGFAALQDGGTVKRGKEEKKLELGAVLWVYFHPLANPVALDKR